MQTAPKPKPRALQGVRQQARVSIQQILNEPFEILSDAGEQITGAPVPTQNNIPPQQPQVDPEEVKKKQQRESRHMQAFQEELKEIQRLQKQREQERAQLRMQEEQARKQKQAQENQQKPLLEPIARIKRGILGGVKGMLRRKQTQVEVAKTPSN